MSNILYVNKDKNVLNQNNITFQERAKELEKLDELELRAKKREKQSTFCRWTQFNLEHTKDLMWLSLKHPKAHAILYFLVDQMDQHNAIICSYQVLQDILQVSNSTVKRAIKTLKDKGFIAILKSGSSNIYTINDEIYWKSWGNQKQYSKFPANVVISFDEQEKELQKRAIDIKNIKHKEVIKNKTEDK